YGFDLAVESVRRNGANLPVEPQLTLAPGDIVLLTGRREAIVTAGATLGEEVDGTDFGMVIAEKLDVVMTRGDLHGRTIAQVRGQATPENGRGVYISAVTRLETTVPALPNTELNRGDVLTLVGAKADVERGAKRLGYILVATQKTDFVFLGLGVLVGMAIGHFGGKIGGVSGWL